MKFLTYYDLSKEQKQGFSLQEKAFDMVVKEQVVPGAFGYPPLYIRHLTLTFKDETCLIISQTDQELTPAKRLEIIAEAVKFLSPDEPA